MENETPDAVDRATYAEQSVRNLLTATGQALELMAKSWSEPLVASWTAHVTASRGRVIVSGMGKSGLVGQKIAATLASTGCPSFFLHPAEALHGDLGMVTADDTMLILSNSGETEEIVRILPSLVRFGAPIASITSRAKSTLGMASKWCFDYTLPHGEGCPLGVAPMASTTMQLVWGDLLAAHRMSAAGFSQAKFAEFHPGGSLGSKFLLVRDLMHQEFPIASKQDGFANVLRVMTSGRLGMAVVQGGSGMVGVISDGDVRRAVERTQGQGANPLHLRACDFMTSNPVVVAPDQLALEAAAVMEGRKITFLVVQDAGRPVGVLHIHDLLAAKVL